MALEILALTALLSTIGLVAYHWRALPPEVPTHFGFDGRPDAWGARAHLWWVPLGALALYAGTTALARWPWLFNYPFAITATNATAQYRLAREMLGVTKCLALFMLLWITWVSVRAALGLATGLGVRFTFACLGALVVNFVVYFARAYRAR
jgi:hypothetical protein